MKNYIKLVYKTISLFTFYWDTDRDDLIAKWKDNNEIEDTFGGDIWKNKSIVKCDIPIIKCDMFIKKYCRQLSEKPY